MTGSKLEEKLLILISCKEILSIRTSNLHQMESIPFGIQPAMPPDPYQTHTQPAEVQQLAEVNQTNYLPFFHFTGPHPIQINQPQFLSVNDQLFGS